MQDRLAELAIAALDDPDAAVVLGDWVLENKWFHRGVMVVLNEKQYDRATDSARRKAHFRMAARGARAWARAVLAALIFGEWPTPAKPVMLVSPGSEVEDLGNGASIVRYLGLPPQFTPGEHPWPVMSRCYVEPWLEAWYGRLYTQAPGVNWRLTL